MTAMMQAAEGEVGTPIYSRANPSPRYRELVGVYRKLHEEGDIHTGMAPDVTFDGRSLLPHLKIIKQAIDGLAARTILDYGAGKGHQYRPISVKSDTGAVFPDVKAYWGVDEIVCYDPGFGPFSTLPERQFDGVVCTDVLEHVPEEDIAWLLDEMFGYARKFVFGTIALFEAAKLLPNGANAHCTLKPIEWWRTIITRAAAAHRGPYYRFELYRGSPTNPDNPYPAPEIIQG